MIWWLKARQAHVVLPASLAGLAALTLAFQDTTALLPSISLSGGTQTQVMTFVAIVPVAAVARCLDSRLPAPEISGIRPVRRLDTLLVLSVVAASLLVGFAIGALTGSSAAWAVGRNTAFLTGLMLCFHALFGTPAVMVPVAWVMAVVLVGYRTFTDPYFWAIVPEPLGAPHAAIAAALALAAGIAAQLRSSRNQP